MERLLFRGGKADPGVLEMPGYGTATKAAGTARTAHFQAGGIHGIVEARRAMRETDNDLRDQTENPAAGTPPAATGQRKAVYLVISVVLSLGGVGGFLYLFIRDFNVYWLILSPIILAIYQFPAVYFYWLYKRSGAKRPADNLSGSGLAAGEDGGDGPAGTAAGEPNRGGPGPDPR
jgi:hypothetical protein